MKEREINIPEIVWDLLICWRPVLVFTLVVTLLIMTAGYTRDVSEYRKSRQEAGAPEKIVDNLTDEERGNVRYVVNLHDKIEEYQRYDDESLFMQIDPNNFYRVTETYLIKVPKGGNASAVANTYYTKLSDTGSLQKLQKILGTDEDPVYLRELIENADKRPDASEEQTSTASLRITVNLPNTLDAEKISARLLKMIEGPLKRDVTKAADHDLTHVGSSVRLTSDSNIAATQATLLSITNTQKANLQTRLSALTAVERTAYNSIVEITDQDTETAAGTDNTAPADPKPSFFSVKFCTFGIILGLVLSFGIAFCLQIFTRRIQYVSDFESCGITCYGALWNKDFTKGIRNLWFDAAVYRRHHGQAFTCRDLAERLSKKMDRMGKETFLIVRAQETSSKEIDELLTDLKKMSSRTIDLLDGTDDPDKMENLLLAKNAGSDCAVLVIAECGKSFRSVVERAVDVSGMYQIDVCGGALLDC